MSLFTRARRSFHTLRFRIPSHTHTHSPNYTNRRSFFTASKLTPDAYTFTEEQLYESTLTIFGFAVAFIIHSLNIIYVDEIFDNHVNKSITSLLHIQTFFQTRSFQQLNSPSDLLETLREVDRFITEFEHLLSWKGGLLRPYTVQRIENFFKASPVDPSDSSRGPALESAKRELVKSQKMILLKMIYAVNKQDELGPWAKKTFHQSVVLSFVVEEMYECLERIGDACKVDFVTDVEGEE